MIRPQFIYVAENTDRTLIKIGISHNPEQRIKCLTNPFGKREVLMLLGIFHGTITQEKQAHWKFRHLSVAGEWYHHSTEILEFIAALAERDIIIPKHRMVPLDEAIEKRRRHARELRIMNRLDHGGGIYNRLRVLRALARAQESVLAAVINEELAHGDATKLVAEIGVSPQFLSDIRKGKRRVGDALLARMCCLGLKVKTR